VSIKLKLWSVVLLALVGGLLTVGSNAFLSFLSLRDEMRNNLEHRVDAAYALVTYQYELSQKGEISEAVAKQRALAAVKVLGMSDPTLYIWIHDLKTPIPRMIMHPFYPALDGKVLDDPKFNCAKQIQLGREDRLISLENTKNLFVAMNEVVSKVGSGYVIYDWTKPLSKTQSTKEKYKKGSFVKKFAPWGWVLGSGIYQDEMISRALIGFAKSSVILFFYVLVIFLVALWILRSIAHPVNRLIASLNIFKHDFSHRATVEGADEIGFLALEFNAMADEISVQIDVLRQQEIELEAQGSQIEAHNEHLEEMVAQRTQELVKANQERHYQWEVIDRFVLTSTTDANGMITYISKAFCDALGYSKEELMGKNHRIIKSPNAPLEFYLELWSTISRGNTWFSELQNRAKDGSLHWYKLQISPIVDENNTIKGYTAIRENIDDRVEAQKLAITDQLTGLYNRREIDRVLKLHADFSQRYETPYCVIMIDMDKFKEVNDLYGHQVGDSVLQELSNLLKKEIRRTDVVGRWGGEEFLVILPNIQYQVSLNVAENLRVAVESFTFTYVGHKTISLGVATYEGSVEEMVKQADEALYRAKESGRNRVR